MKHIRRMCLLLSILVITLMFVYKDKIVSYAANPSAESLHEGMVIKNGTTFDFDISDSDSGSTATGIMISYHVGNTWDSYTIIPENHSYSSEDLERFSCYYDSSGVIDDHCLISNNFTINNDNSEYWLVDAVYSDCMFDGYEYVLVPYEYEEPEFFLSCDPTVLEKGKESDCTLSVKTYYDIKNISFDLEVDNFKVSGETKGEFVKAFTHNDDGYQAEFDWAEYSTSGYEEIYRHDREFVLMNFKIKSDEDKEVNDADNVRIKNIVYDDKVGKNQYDMLKTTITQKKQEIEKSEEPKEEENKNPNTNDYIAILLVLATLSLSIFAVLKRKQIVK